jgi:hypothetical protein
MRQTLAAPGLELAAMGAFIAPSVYPNRGRGERESGGNAVFGGVSCCTAGPGFDLASGLGSPLANQVVQHLHH